MVQISEGRNAFVLVDDEKAQEYQIEESTSGLVKTYTCFIEAREGAEFRVEVENPPYEEDKRHIYQLFVDGKFVNAYGSGCDPSRYRPEVHFQGYPEQKSSAGSIFRSFTFGKMQVTSDNSAKKLSTDDVENACTLRLEIVRYVRSGPIKHLVSQPLHQQMPPSRIVHEDSKPALWGLEAKPGREMHIGATTMCHCKLIRDETAVKQVVIFKYLPHGWLVAKGLKQGEMQEEENDDIQIVNRIASRRRAREQQTSPVVRNLRVKREQTVKSEVSTVFDLDLSTPIDLTREDDAPISRKIGDTIVIEDDTEDEEENV